MQRERPELRPLGARAGSSGSIDALQMPVTGGSLRRRSMPQPLRAAKTPKQARSGLGRKSCGADS